MRSRSFSRSRRALSATRSDGDGATACVLGRRGVPVACTVEMNAGDRPISGGIWSADLGAAYDMACAIRTGGVSINGGGGPVEGGPVPPFGGFKRSGIGRENGEFGLDAFTELKSIGFRSI